MAQTDIKIPWDGWKIVRIIGRGSFGTVYEIERHMLNNTDSAAIKVISIPKDADALEMMRLASGYDDESVEQSLVTELSRVEREYSLMKRMSGNSNIVSCEDFSYVPHKDSPGYDVFIRMELLQSLQEIIRKSRKSGHSFPEEDVIKIGSDICKALKVCERFNVIHRDIKPQNIMISQLGDYKLGDFGTARSIEHTTQATFAGTLSFMAPEVFRREKYGKTVDLYSLGLVMYWLLNRYRMPFVPLGEAITPDLMMSAENRRASGEALDAPCDASPELSKIILKACAFRSDEQKNHSEILIKLFPFCPIIGYYIVISYRHFQYVQHADQQHSISAAETAC